MPQQQQGHSQEGVHAITLSSQSFSLAARSSLPPDRPNAALPLSYLRALAAAETSVGTPHAAAPPADYPPMTTPAGLSAQIDALEALLDRSWRDQDGLALQEGREAAVMLERLHAMHA